MDSVMGTKIIVLLLLAVIKVRLRDDGLTYLREAVIWRR